MTDYEQAAVNIVTLYRTLQERMEAAPGLAVQWTTLEYQKTNFGYHA